MQWLMIENPGVANPHAFTSIGVSTTRQRGIDGTIGQFGSGAKYSLALLMRTGHEIVICAGNLKMDFFTKQEMVDGYPFDLIHVKYSGKNHDGKTQNYSESLKCATTMGQDDWNNPAMALREYGSNALDGALISGKTLDDVKFEVVDGIRAKANHTRVFISLSPQMELLFNQRDKIFLHFRRRTQLQSRVLSKYDDAQELCCYKKGVLALKSKRKSVFDYNLPDLELDEARNAPESTVRATISAAVRDMTVPQLVYMFEKIKEQPDIYEAELDQYSVMPWKETDKKMFQDKLTEALKKVYGDTAIVTDPSGTYTENIARKGFKPVVLPEVWSTTTRKLDVLSYKSVLDTFEQNGITKSPPTQPMSDSLLRVWRWIEAAAMTNGKSMPNVHGFDRHMTAESQTFGMYYPGDTAIYLHQDIAGDMLDKVTLEELAHYITGATDMSRDLQDWTFKFAVRLAGLAKL